MSVAPRGPLVLAVLDGFGLSPAGPDNAITLAETPHWTRWWATAPHSQLSASGEDVGLPDRLMGNSEVGHLNLGAGRIVDQPIMQITRAIRDGAFATNPALVAACRHARATGGALHLMGLVSDGGVHSHISQVPAFLALARREGVSRVYVHAFLDGRDTPPTSGVDYVRTLLGMLREAGVGELRTLMGRYWAMDRDQRWERVERAWRALVMGEGTAATDPEAAVRAAYAREVTDEFVEPIVLGAPGPAAPGSIHDGDAVLHMNFRPDRARELTYALTQDAFTGFARPVVPANLAYVCLTRYDEKLALPVAFPPPDILDTLGDVYAEAGLRQLRIAETEKYAHVTYFFSGGRETPLVGEERCLVPSPRVATYDLEPAMSAGPVTDELVRRLGTGAPDLVVLNYANADMVGHTGVLAATVRAVETLDVCLARVATATLAAGGLLVITADHGNAEQMWDAARNEPHTAHTSNPVPLVVLGDAGRAFALKDGILADVAPTVLALVGLPQPSRMTGRSLLVDPA
jgi:2,3-bisphosphoglycerate-independent phosphoglycerate mutase